MVKRKVYRVRYHMVDTSGKIGDIGKVVSFSGIFTYEYFEDAADELLELGFEPHGTLGSKLVWKRCTGKEGFYTLGTVERVEEE